MSGMEQDLANELKTFCEKHADRVRFAYLFGSAARGNPEFVNDFETPRSRI